MVLMGGLTWGERFSQGSVTTVQGMVTIFAVLALLWGVIELLHFSFSHSGKQKKEKPAPVAEAPVAVTEENAVVSFKRSSGNGRANRF